MLAPSTTKLCEKQGVGFQCTSMGTMEEVQPSKCFSEKLEAEGHRTYLTMIKSDVSWKETAGLKGVAKQLADE